SALAFLFAQPLLLCLAARLFLQTAPLRCLLRTNLLFLDAPSVFLFGFLFGLLLSALAFLFAQPLLLCLAARLFLQTAPLRCLLRTNLLFLDAPSVFLLRFLFGLQLSTLAFLFSQARLPCVPARLFLQTALLCCLLSTNLLFLDAPSVFLLGFLFSLQLGTLAFLFTEPLLLCLAFGFLTPLLSCLLGTNLFFLDAPSVFLFVFPFVL